MNTTPNPIIVKELNLDDLTPGQIHRLRVRIIFDGMGDLVSLPVIIAKGTEDGPILGLTAAMHGNELNGIPTIHHVLNHLNVKKLKGAVVGVPIVNVPGFHLQNREFADNYDLNRVMPGKKNGNNSQVYASRIMNRIIKHFDYMLDLHTASFGRVNALYVRANLNDPVTKTMARLQNPQIIVNNMHKDGTLRGAAAKLGIPSITVEIGNPQRFQPKLIKESSIGIFNVMAHLGMIQKKERLLNRKAIICNKSYWLYTETGGLLEVFPEVAESVKKGELIARVTNIFGDILKEYHAPENGVVVGKSTNPVNPTGSRILHLGVN